MIREEIVFGPIRSRRLGSSLGINVLPEQGKLCNFDCIYCECGWNADGRGDHRIPSAAQLASALELKLSSCRDAGVEIDSITFSGDGEPTLNPDFPQMVDVTLSLRDRYYPQAKVSVLSNATMVGREGVFEALRKVDNPILKLDAPTTALAALINRPAAGYDVDGTVEALRRFDGDFILQTMFLRSSDFDSSSAEVLGPWLDIVRELHPRLVMVYTVDRPAPQQGLQKFDPEQMRAMVQPLLEEGFNIQING